MFDPLISKQDLKDSINNITFTTSPRMNHFDAVLLCVPHNEFKRLGSKKIKSFLVKEGIFFDVKAPFKKNESDLRL